MTSKTKVSHQLKHIVSLCKRRGFIYPGSEIYGGFANTYSYGPYGTELKKNIKDLWWKLFVQKRLDVVGLDGSILLHPKTWQASGHVDSFSDAMVDCKQCRLRHRADHLLEEALKRDVEGLSLVEMNQLLEEHAIACPGCGSKDLTQARSFNLMFHTRLSKVSESNDDIAYLRPETAQAIFLDYKNIVDTTRVKLPFGVAQIGKAFRNEITPGNFIFRLIEFEQMEIEYFIREEKWQEYFDLWLDLMMKWCERIGLKKESLNFYEHPQEKLSHYSKRTVDIMFKYPFGEKELYGIAYRTDFDLSQHAKESGKKLDYQDLENKKKFLPHVIEPTFGVDRTILALLCDAYEEETLSDGQKRIVLHLDPKIAPVKVAIFPLMKKEPLMDLAQKIFDTLHELMPCEFDISGSIGKRYRRQDELGTPYCVTIDYESLEDQSVTIRERDSMEQKRHPISALCEYFLSKGLH